MGERRAKLREHGRKETGAIAAPSSGASSYSVAIVRPWLPSSESESSEPDKSVLTYYSNTSFHSIAAAPTHTWRIAWCAHLRTARPHPPPERPPPSRLRAFDDKRSRDDGTIRASYHDLVSQARFFAVIEIYKSILKRQLNYIIIDFQLRRFNNDSLLKSRIRRLKMNHGVNSLL